MNVTDDIRQRCRAEVWHANSRKAAQLMDRVNRNDIRVLKLSQLVRFRERLSRNLQDNQPIGEITLSSEIDATEVPATEFALQEKTEDFGTHSRKFISVRRNQSIREARLHIALLSARKCVIDPMDEDGCALLFQIGTTGQLSWSGCRSDIGSLRPLPRPIRPHAVVRETLQTPPGSS